MLVYEQVGQLLLYLTYGVGHVHLVGAYPGWEGVDEQPRNPVLARSGLHPAEQHGAEHHVLASRGRRDHPCPHRVEHRGRAHAQPPCLVPQPPGQLVVQGQYRFV